MTRLPRPWLVLLPCVLLTLAVSPAWAQVQPLPTRPYRGLFGGRPPQPGQTGTTVSATLSALGGYDDNVLASTTGAPSAVDTRFGDSGYTGVGSAAISLARAGTRRSLNASFSSTVSAYSVTGANTAQSYNASLGGRTEVGRRGSLSVDVSGGYRNFFSIGSFRGAPVVDGPILDTGSPDYGVYDRRSWDVSGGASASRSWGRAQQSSVSLRARRSEYLDDDTGSAEGWSANVGHSVSMGRRAALTSTYGYSDETNRRRDGTSRPVTTHTAQAGYSYRRQFSPRKAWAVDLGAGGTLIDTVGDLVAVPTDRWTATGHAGLTVDLGRTWSVRGRYQRGWELRDGFSSPFFTDDVVVSAGGYLSSRVDLVVSGGYGTGATGVTVENPYRSRTGSAQLRVALSRTSAIVVNYLRYYYEFDSIALLPAGVPPESDRQAVRVGLTFWLPLYGAFGAQGATP